MEFFIQFLSLRKTNFCLFRFSFLSLAPRIVGFFYSKVCRRGGQFKCNWVLFYQKVNKFDPVKVCISFTSFGVLWDCFKN